MSRASVDMVEVDLSQDSPVSVSNGERYQPMNESECGLTYFGGSNSSADDSDEASIVVLKSSHVEKPSCNTNANGTHRKKQKVDNKVALTEAIDLSVLVDEEREHEKGSQEIEKMTGTVINIDSDEDLGEAVNASPSASKAATTAKVKRKRGKRKCIFSISMLLDKSLESLQYSDIGGMPLAAQLVLREHIDFSISSTAHLPVVSP